MDFDLSPDQVMLRDTIRRLVADKVAPRAGERDRSGELPREVIDELAGMGLFGVTVSPDWDGVGLGPVELALVVEELARGDASLALVVASHNAACCAHLQRFASEGVQERFLGPLARGEMLGTVAIAEVAGGTAGIEAKREGQDWVFTGTTPFVTLGTRADVGVVLAETDRSAATQSATAFVIEKTTPGVERTPHDDTVGMRAADKARWTFSNARISDGNRIGEIGRGMEHGRETLESALVATAALAVGIGRGALAAAVTYALERQQFNQPIANFQAIQWKLADMATDLDAAALLVGRCAHLAAAGQPFASQACMAKLSACEAAMRAADETVQIHGGYGYTSDFPAERFYRDARVVGFGEGTRETQRREIARALLDRASA